MNNHLNIAIIIDVFDTKGGAFRSAMKAASSLRSMAHTVTIVCTTKRVKEELEGVIFLKSIDCIIDFIQKSNLDAIVYMKAAKSSFKTSIFNNFVRAQKKSELRIPIITVVCQQPANFSTILTPYEINNSNHLIFIDKTAYHTPLYNFIPESKKSWTYLSIPDANNSINDRYCKTNYDIKDKTIVFGRGSSLGKCPKDTLDVFDRISVTCNKLFIIAGVYPSGNWLARKVARRNKNNVIIKAPMPFDEWLTEASKFDIFLYYLPPKCHSSIDGTLGQVMLMGIPPVVYGPEAPKERIKQGVNGFIANTKDEFIKYAEMLANDTDLRSQIGKEARLTTIKLNSVNWTNKLVELIYKETDSTSLRVKIPVLKSLYIYMVVLLNYIFLLPCKFLSFIQKPNYYLKH